MKQLLLIAAMALVTASANAQDHTAHSPSQNHMPPHDAPVDFDQSAIEGDIARIDGLLRSTFETEAGELSLNPIIQVGNHAVVGWVQYGQGGRAVLSKNDHGIWKVDLCGGDAIKGQSAFKLLGMSESDAAQMAEQQQIEEAKLDPKIIDLMDSFGQTVFFE